MGDDRKEVEWDDDFAPRETRRFRWDLIADQLRQRPGRWAKVVGSGGRQLTQPAVDGRGSLCPEGLQWRKTTYRSAVCAAQPKRRAQLRRSADGRTGGEPWWWESTIARVEEP